MNTIKKHPTVAEMDLFLNTHHVEENRTKKMNTETLSHRCLSFRVSSKMLQDD